MTIPTRTRVDDPPTTELPRLDADGDPVPPRVLRPRLRLPALLAAVAVLLTCGAATLVGTQWWANSERTAVQTAAQDHARALMTIDPARSVDDARAVLDASTGEFADLYRRNGDQYVSVVRDGQVRMTVDSVLTGVVSVDGDAARVLTAVRVTSHDVDHPDGEKRSYRLSEEMRKEGGRWLVSRIDFGR
ncbi:hypothetical protein ACL02T_31730 [Pseudonocardia sp. RS010]|uniref:hypothetical protein n=1 Tax=Pseudonocardia sp. RS010 TaxID=3385979 RepID=UPI0039A277BE